MLRRMAENIPALTVPLALFTTIVVNGNRLPSALFISWARSLKSSRVLPSPT